MYHPLSFSLPPRVLANVALLECPVPFLTQVAGFVGRLRANANDRGGIVLDAGVVEREADRVLEGVAAMLSGVPHILRDEGREGVIVGDLNEDQEEHLPDRQEIVV